jgi:hypothetical protein
MAGAMAKVQISNWEDYNMYRAHRYVAALFLAIALAVAMSTMSFSRPEEATVQVRVYDRTHKDYHHWDAHENDAWRVYLSNSHVTFHEYTKANRREQDGYWNWRHSHPDGR